MNPKKETEQQVILSTAYFDFQKGLNARAFYKVNDHSLGQDLVQSTFLKTWSFIVKGGEINVMKAFLYNVLNELIIDEYRKRKSSSLDVLIEKGFELELSENRSENLFNFLDGKKVILLIALLPLKYQKVMRMKYVQDLSLEEMSLVTGQTKNSIAVQAYRGLEKLKVLYNRQ